MKKILIALSICASFAACSGSSTQTTDTDTAMTADSDSAMAAKHTAKTTETNVDTNVTKTGATPATDSAKN